MSRDDGAGGAGRPGMAPGEDDHRHLRAAIDAGRAALARGDMPFGAVLVRDGHALLAAMNEQITRADPTGHAELVLVRTAARELGPGALRGATVYASGEPCAMCAGAMFWAGIGRVVYGAPSPDMAVALGGPLLPARCAELLSAASPPVEVVGPLLREEAVAALGARGG